MASMQRTIARNIARERLIAGGYRHINRKHSVGGDNRLQYGKRSYLITAQSLLGQAWRKLSAYVAAKHKPRKSRKQTKD